MAAIGETQDRLSRLSKAELVAKLEVLRRRNRGQDAGKANGRQGELALRVRDSLLGHAVRMAKLGCWIWDDIENKCIYCSEQLAEMHGITVEEYLERFGYGAIIEGVHPEDRTHYIRELNSATELKQAYAIEFRKLLPDGSVRNFREQGEPVVNADGDLAYTVGIFQDITETKRADEALGASEERFRRIAEESPLMFWEYDAEGEPAYFNPASLAFLGLSLEEALASDIYANVHPEDRERIRALDCETLVAPGPFQHEYRLRHADGTYRWVLEIGAPRFGPGGVHQGDAGYCIDITKSKRAGAAARTSEERFRSVADDLPVMLWVYGKDDEPVFFNRATLEFMGLSLEEALAFDYYHGIHPDDRERARSVEGRWVNPSEGGAVEYRARRVDGTYRWVRDVIVPRYAPDGSFKESIGCSIDITEEKAASAALQASEARYRELFEDSPISLWVEDWSNVKVVLDGLAGRGIEDLRSYFRDHPDQIRQAYHMIEIVDVSEKALRVFRAPSKAEFLDLFRSDHVDPDELSGFSEQVARLYGGAEKYDYENCITVCDGTEIHTHTRTVIPAKYRDTWSRVFVSIDDISQRATADATLREREAGLRELQRQLEHQTRASALGELSRELTREVDQPLTAMISYNSTARRILAAGGAPGSDEIIALLDKAAGQATLAGDVVRRLRDLTGMVDTAATVQDVNQIVEEALILAVIDPEQADIPCALDLCKTLPPVVVNKIRIQEVAFNLIKNALEAMAGSERRELTIQTSLDRRGAIEVCVCDSGPGIPRNMAQKIFEPFVTTKERSLGLGLSICKGIVELHGGRLWAAPNPGGGTCFFFTLPAAGPAGTTCDA